MGTLMYLVEGEAHGFNDIPHSAYWAIVTLTTVGYGNITPQTTLGRFIASIIMIMGYDIIAVPTGIFSLELRQAAQARNARAPLQIARRWNPMRPRASVAAAASR